MAEVVDHSKFQMPEWMERYRHYIYSGGFSVEEMMDDITLIEVNAPRALIAVGVKEQVALLFRMHKGTTLQ